jgi:hypothetical protein
MARQSRRQFRDAADVLAFGGVFLAVPATLARMRALRPGSPILAVLSGGTALVGWMALTGAQMTDVVATAGGVVAAGLLRGPSGDQPSVIGMRTPRASATSTASS